MFVVDLMLFLFQRMRPVSSIQPQMLLLLLVTITTATFFFVLPYFIVPIKSYIHRRLLNGLIDWAISISTARHRFPPLLLLFRWKELLSFYLTERESSTGRIKHLNREREKKRYSLLLLAAFYGPSSIGSLKGRRGGLVCVCVPFPCALKAHRPAGKEAPKRRQWMAYTLFFFIFWRNDEHVSFEVLLLLFFRLASLRWHVRPPNVLT